MAVADLVAVAYRAGPGGLCCEPCGLVAVARVMAADDGRRGNRPCGQGGRDADRHGNGPCGQDGRGLRCRYRAFWRKASAWVVSVADLVAVKDRRPRGRGGCGAGRGRGCRSTWAWALWPGRPWHRLSWSCVAWPS